MTAFANLMARHPRLRASDLARAVLQEGRQAGKPLSGAATSRLIHRDEWPKETSRQTIQRQIKAFLTGSGIPEAEIEELWKAGATAIQSDTNRPGDAGTPTEEKGKTMLPQAQILTRAARAKFGLPFNPFEGLPLTEGEYFLTEAMHGAMEAFGEAAQLRVLRAVVGESGSGKTSLKRLFRLKWGKSLNLIEVLVTTMSDNDKRGGRIMPSSQIHTAIIRHFEGDDARIPNSDDARQRRSRRLLQAAAESGKGSLLVIDEAHDLGAHTFSHLKRFHELADGALGILLIGQPALAAKLSPRLAPEIKEAGQRFPVEWLPPLDAEEVKAYLGKRLAKAGAEYGAVFEPDAAAAIVQMLTRLEESGRGAAREVSEAFPLAVGNLAVAAVNRCAHLGFERVTAAMVASAAREV